MVYPINKAIGVIWRPKRHFRFIGRRCKLWGFRSGTTCIFY